MAKFFLYIPKSQLRNKFAQVYCGKENVMTLHTLSFQDNQLHNFLLRNNDTHISGMVLIIRNENVLHKELSLKREDELVSGFVH